MRIYTSISFFYCLFFLYGQTPFLEIRPYAKPDFVQYDLKNHVDHHFPTANITDGNFRRFDGINLTEELMFPNCEQGSACYDGHAGVDYYMPAGTPILAPADGYVIWSAFSPGADPCPGGISPNGDTGIIILAHPGTDHFSCYLHLEPPLNVAVGETVSTGDTLGFAGNTGCAQTPHLHFEIRKDTYFFDEQLSYAVDPFGWWGTESDPIEGLRGNRSEWLWKSSWLIDDNDNGFQRYYGPLWDRMAVGYQGDSWIAPSTSDLFTSRHYAIWVPELEENGEYNIDVYIPSGLDAATAAIYEIYVKNIDLGTSEKTLVIYDQTSNTDNFSTIATLDLPEGSNCSVILRDNVESGSIGSFVVFDAIRFTNTSTVGVDKSNFGYPAHNSLSIKSIYPNPFNPQVTVDYNINTSEPVSIIITDLTGKHIKKINQVFKTKGMHSITWIGDNDYGAKVSSGLYFLSVKAGNSIKTAKILLLE